MICANSFIWKSLNLMKLHDEVFKWQSFVKIWSQFTQLTVIMIQWTKANIHVALDGGHFKITWNFIIVSYAQRTSTFRLFIDFCSSKWSLLPLYEIIKCASILFLIHLRTSLSIQLANRMLAVGYICHLRISALFELTQVIYYAVVLSKNEHYRF